MAFKESFFYNLLILIKLYKIRYLNLNKALLFKRNQAIFLKNWKLWGAPTTTKFNIFCWNCAHVSYLTMSTKACLGFFILFRSWVINKNVETRSFFIFVNNSRFKQNKKYPEHSFVDIGKEEGCAKFQQKLLKPIAVGALQNFQFFRQKTWFL